MGRRSDPNDKYHRTEVAIDSKLSLAIEIEIPSRVRVELPLGFRLPGEIAIMVGMLVRNGQMVVNIPIMVPNAISI